MDSRKRSSSGDKSTTKAAGKLLSALKRKTSATGSSDKSPTRNSSSDRTRKSVDFGRVKTSISVVGGFGGGNESFNGAASKEAAKMVSEWVKSGSEKTAWASDIAKIISAKLKLQHSVKLLSNQVTQLEAELEVYQNLNKDSKQEKIESPPETIEPEQDDREFEESGTQTEDVTIFSTQLQIDSFTQTPIKTFASSYQQCTNLTVVVETSCQTEQDVKLCEPVANFECQTDPNLTQNETASASQQTKESSFISQCDQFCQFPELVAKVLPVNVQWETTKPLVHITTLPALALVKRESSSLKQLVTVNKHALKTSVPIVQSPRHGRKSRFLQMDMFTPEEAQLRASILNEYLENYLETRQQSSEKSARINHQKVSFNQQQATINKELSEVIENKQRQLEALGNLQKLYYNPRGRLQLSSNTNTKNSAGLNPSRPQGSRSRRCLRRNHQKLVVKSDSDSNSANCLPSIDPNNNRMSLNKLLPAYVYRALNPDWNGFDPTSDETSAGELMKSRSATRGGNTASNSRLRKRSASGPRSNNNLPLGHSILNWNVPMPHCKCESCALMLPSSRTSWGHDNLKLNSLSVKVGSRVAVQPRRDLIGHFDALGEDASAPAPYPVTGVVRYLGHVSRLCPSQPNGVYVGVELDDHVLHLNPELANYVGDGSFLGRRYFTAKNNSTSALFVPIQDVFPKTSKTLDTRRSSTNRRR